MDELVVGKMYYVSENALEEAVNYRNIKYKFALCKCTSKRGKFKVREGVYRYMKYWVAEKGVKMEKRISNEGVCNIIKASGHVSKDAMPSVLLRTAQDLQDARKELEEAKKDSVWQDAPKEATSASVLFCGEAGYIDRSAKEYKRTLPKTPKQELIDSFAEKNALAMKCSGLNKELLEAFVKEYEDMQK